MAAIVVSNGANIDIVAAPHGTLNVSNYATVSVFRGIQVVHADLSISNGSEILLTEHVFGGTISNVGLPYLLFKESLRIGYEFISGQFYEIPEIMLDSSVRIGVKLYTYDNTVLNAETYKSATFSFDNDLQIEANIDPETNTLDIVATASQMSVLTKGKVYTLTVNAVDQSDNDSIVLSKKVRFI